MEEDDGDIEFVEFPKGVEVEGICASLLVLVACF